MFPLCPTQPHHHRVWEGAVAVGGGEETVACDPSSERISLAMLPVSSSNPRDSSGGCGGCVLAAPAAVADSSAYAAVDGRCLFVDGGEAGASWSSSDPSACFARKSARVVNLLFRSCGATRCIAPLAPSSSSAAAWSSACPCALCSGCPIMEETFENWICCTRSAVRPSRSLSLNAKTLVGGGGGGDGGWSDGGGGGGWWLE